MALLWKNLIAVGRLFTARFWIMMAIIGTVFIGGFASAGKLKNASVLASIVIGAILGYSLLLGPQLLRVDFRQDLPYADILKTFPLPGWQIVLGELLAPVVVLASAQWILLFIGLLLVVFLPGHHAPLALVIGLSAVYFLPVLDTLMLIIPNTAVLLFPSWVQAGKDAPRGIEATGQRLIFAVGQLLALTVTLIPAALAFMTVYFPLKIVFGPILPIPFGTLAATLVIAVEAGLGVMWLGHIFERFDVTEESGA